jgi:hypothetical protein
MTAASQTLRLTDTISVTGQRFRYVFTIRRKKICVDCCRTEREKFALDANWLAIGDQVNRTGLPLKCDHCGGTITSRPHKM